MSPEVRKLPPPVQDHLIHLLPQGLHVGIGKASVQRARAVRVRTRSADGAVESAEPFHAIPGVKLSHANPESHDTGCGMGPEFAGTGGRSGIFSREDGLRR
jgi:hypothetical protein